MCKCVFIHAQRKRRKRRETEETEVKEGQERRGRRKVTQGKNVGNMDRKDRM
jgi:hypothetical protein